MNAAQLLSPDSAKPLCDSVDAFLFDCDGVIWKGDELIDGATQTLDMLRSMGKKLVFVTNNSTKSRRKYAEKFRSLGISVSEDEIFCSSFAAAMYLKSIQFPTDKKVYVVGENGILDELELAGFVGLGGPEDGKKTAEFKTTSFFQHDKSVGAVVVGLDQYINYYKLQYATLCIRENPGCIFIATNRDAVGHMTAHQEWPGAGCMVAAVCGSTQKEPIVVGKPSTFMMEFLLKKFQVTPSRMCMVGDRLDTDILFGQSAGCKTLLVLSGVTSESALQDTSNDIQPDHYTNKLSDMGDLDVLPIPNIFSLQSTLQHVSCQMHRLVFGGSVHPFHTIHRNRKPHLRNMIKNSTSLTQASRLLSPAGAKQLFESVDAFVFDCDGVLWKGTKLIDGVPETLEMLRSKGKQLAFVSNNSTKSRRLIAQKFHGLGISVAEDEIYSSTFAAAMYLDSIQFPKDKKVYVFGDQGLIEELELAGYTCLGGPEDGKKTPELKASCLFEHDRSVGAVVVGMDPYINYYKLMYVTLCIRQNPGCLFIATELDPLVHMTDLQEWPVTGCMVAAVSVSTQTEPIVVGKPSAFLMEFLLKKLNLDPSRMCMVGDRLDTDILFGKDAGCSTLLALSGVTNESTLQNPTNNIQPDHYTGKVSDLLELL